MKIKFLKAKIPFSVYIIVFLLILVAGILNFTLNKPSSFIENKDLAIKECIKECQKQRAIGVSLTEGPCLSEEIVEGWACDIINDPKIKLIDDNPKNQCQSYIKKDVKNIVYISDNCSLISTK